MFFSIVVPVHNKEKYIRRTVESILAQTHKDFELVLIDDGSKDESGRICEEYAAEDKRIVVIHQLNAGVSAARNVGIHRASYQYIAFIDADDYWDSSHLFQMTKLIQEFPDVSLYASNYAYIINGKVQPKEQWFTTNKEVIRFDLIALCCRKARIPIHISSVVINKEALLEVGLFDERLISHEDYDIFVRLALRSEFVYLNRVPQAFYDIGIPNETKARGRVPDIHMHWVSHLDKFDRYVDSDADLKLFLDRFRLKSLIKYRKHQEYSDEVKRILEQVDKKNYGWKYRIIYCLPSVVGNKVLSVHKFYSKIKLQSLKKHN